MNPSDGDLSHVLFSYVTSVGVSTITHTIPLVHLVDVMDDPDVTFPTPLREQFYKAALVAMTEGERWISDRIQQYALILEVILPDEDLLGDFSVVPEVVATYVARFEGLNEKQIKQKKYDQAVIDEDQEAIIELGGWLADKLAEKVEFNDPVSLGDFFVEE
jgi:hypothetical protein